LYGASEGVLHAGGWSLITGYLREDTDDINLPTIIVLILTKAGLIPSFLHGRIPCKMTSPVEVSRISRISELVS
jgi:hypothetical protein